MLCALLLAAATLPPAEARIAPRAVGSDPRSQRPWVFSAELGWNGLAGVGVVMARHLHPQLTLEAGLGISAVGPKVGVRARYNFLVEEWTPFAGLGFLYGTGGGTGPSWSFSGEATNYGYSIGPSAYLQAVAGLEYQGMSGLNFTAAAGYAGLLRQNLTVTGSPTPDQLSTLRIFTGSGPVFSLSLGHAF